MSIRKALESDGHSIGIIEKENFSGFFRRKEETIKKLIKNKNFESYVFIYEGVAGYIFLEYKVGYLYIENISVAKFAQGKGIGKALMLQAEEVAKRVGYKGIALDVLKNNESAIGLYKKFGYIKKSEGKSQQRMIKILK